MSAPWSRTRTPCARASSASPRRTPRPTRRGCATGAPRPSRATSSRGCPGPRDEAWRHTPLGAAHPHALRARRRRGARRRPRALALVPRRRSRGAEVVFVNGRFAPALSRLERPPARASRSRACATLREGAAGARARARPRAARGRPASSPTSTPPSPRTARVVDDRARRGGQRADPRASHVSAPGAAPTRRLPAHARRRRPRQRVDASSRRFVGPDGRRLPASTRVTEVGARGRRPGRPLQAAARGRGRACTSPPWPCRLGRDARFSDHAVTLGAALVAQRHRGCASRARAASACSNGLFVLDGRRVVRHPLAHRPRPAALHEPPALQGHPRRAGARRLQRPRARAPGRAEDGRGADRTATCCSRARRSCTRRRSSRSCADDVKCKHGSTIGQLDPAALFYLRSRGIGEAAARSLLTWAFASDLLRGVRGRGACARRSSGTCRRTCPASRRCRRRCREQPAATVRAGAAWDVEAVRREFPILAADGPRQAARLPRQRGERAEAARGDRRRARRLRALLREHPPRRAPAVAARDRRLREGARARVRRFLNAAEHARDRLRARHDRGDQPGGADATAASTSAPATRC